MAGSHNKVALAAAREKKNPVAMRLRLNARLVELDTGTGTKQEPSQNEDAVTLILHEDGRFELQNFRGDIIVSPLLGVAHGIQFGNSVTRVRKWTHAGNVVTLVFGRENHTGGFAIAFDLVESAGDFVYAPDVT
jgi:hypothetical protein